MSERYQYCKLHKIVEKYPACDIGHYQAIRHHKNQQLGPKDRPVLWTKRDKETGKLEIRYPGQTGDMPNYYKTQGYERTEFNSYLEHKKFCDENGLVNHGLEGIKDEALKS